LVLIVLVTSADVQVRDGAKQALRELFRRIQQGCCLQLIRADGGYRGQLIDWVKFALGWTLQITLSMGFS
jgi:hypothetical protein